VKLGVIISPSAGWTYAEIRGLAQGAEKSGFDSFWVSDHFFGGPGGTPDRNCLEAWTLLAALARDTKRTSTGPTGTTSHLPATASSSFATV